MASDVFNVLYRIDPRRMVSQGYEYGEAGIRSFTEENTQELGDALFRAICLLDPAKPEKIPTIAMSPPPGS